MRRRGALRQVCILLCGGVVLALTPQVYGADTSEIMKLIESMRDTVREALNRQRAEIVAEKSAIVAATPNPATDKRLTELISTQKVIESTQSATAGNAPQSVQELISNLETIAAIRRPVWAECASVPWAEGSAEFPNWKPYLEQVQATLMTAAPSVGMFIQYAKTAAGPPQWRRNGATAFAVGGPFVVTNRHVLKEYADHVNGTWQLRENQILRVQFPYEYDGCARRHAPRELEIAGIEVVGTEKYDDFAILRMAPGAAFPPGLPLAQAYSLTGGARVAAIGYPGRPEYCAGRTSVPERPCTHLQEPQIDLLFRTPDGAVPFPAQRISPGTVLYNPTAIPGQFFSYDSSTWGGSSGSPVLSLTDGRVVGLHFQGLTATQDGAGYNNAVVITRLAAALAALQDP